MYKYNPPYVLGSQSLLPNAVRAFNMLVILDILIGHYFISELFDKVMTDTN